jgi:hypothetical protein
MTSTHLAMDYNSLNTAAEILDAFKQCQNAGEEIQLFESLAERANPPVDAFVEILRKIKLETVLALAIQAFGKITNDDVKARLKGSEDLLVMLCEQAKSGATDLIRWSAATTIENVGFSFIDVSQYLAEEPSGIIQRIVQSKINVFIHSPKSIYGVTEHNDQNAFVRFWIYGYTYGLRIATISMGTAIIPTVITEVIKAQDIWGIRQTNSLFQALENQTHFENDTKKISENKVFERETQLLVAELLKQNRNPTDFQFLVANQIHCLQSNIASVRKDAALIMLSFDGHILDVLKQHNPALSSMIAIFSKDSFGGQDDFYYQEVIQIIRCLEIAEKYLNREVAFNYCKYLHGELSHFVKSRKEEIGKEAKEIIQSERAIIDILGKIKLTFPQIYSKYCDVDLGKRPEVDIENDRWQVILSEYHEKIKTIARKLNDQIRQEEKIRQAEKGRQAEFQKIAIKITLCLIFGLIFVGGIYSFGFGAIQHSMAEKDNQEKQQKQEKLAKMSEMEESVKDFLVLWDNANVKIENLNNQIEKCRTPQKTFISYKMEDKRNELIKKIALEESRVGELFSLLSYEQKQYIKTRKRS